MRLLYSLQNGLFRLLAKNVEKAGHLFLSQVVLAGKVFGGVAVEQHLIELFSEAAQSVLALFCSAFQVLERLSIAKIPISGLTRASRQAVEFCVTICLFCINRCTMSDIWELLKK